MSASDSVYHERDQLVAALSKLFPSHLTQQVETEDDDFRWIVCVHLPTGQVTWHIHKDELPLFDHLQLQIKSHWDGHTTEEKYARLRALDPGIGQAIIDLAVDNGVRHYRTGVNE